MRKFQLASLIVVLPVLVACDAGNYILDEIAGRSFVCESEQGFPAVGLQIQQKLVSWGESSCKATNKRGVKQHYECFSKVGPEKVSLRQNLDFDTVTGRLVNAYKVLIPDGVAGEEYYNCRKVSR